MNYRGKLNWGWISVSWEKHLDLSEFFRRVPDRFAPLVFGGAEILRGQNQSRHEHDLGVGIVEYIGFPA